MKVYGLTPDEVRRTVAQTSADEYAGNVRPDNLQDASTRAQDRATFVLRVNDSHGPGARRAPSGRRTVAATWQAHYDVIEDLFLAGAVRVKSSVADYQSLAAFLREAPGTYYHPVGSLMFPAYLGDG